MTDERPQPTFEENVLWVFESLDMQPPPGAIEHRRPGHLFREGWFLDFVWGEENGLECFEYLILHRHPGHDRYRLHADGRWEPLPVPSMGVVIPADATEEEREEEIEKARQWGRKWQAEIDQLGLSTDKYDDPGPFDAHALAERDRDREDR